MAGDPRTLIGRILRLPVEILVGLYLLIDALLWPLVRPVMRGLSRLRIVQRLEQAIASLPPYVILVLLAVPFGVAELAKAYAVILMGTGHFKTGFTIFVGAYIVSLFICERTFSAGKAQLMTIPWFAKGYDWAMSYKAMLFDWLRTTAVWRVAGDLRQKARLVARRVRTRVGVAFSGKRRLFGR